MSQTSESGKTGVIVESGEFNDNTSITIVILLFKKCGKYGRIGEYGGPGESVGSGVFTELCTPDDCADDFRFY